MLCGAVVSSSLRACTSDSQAQETQPGNCHTSRFPVLLPSR
jgi:hypothetical protein